MLRWTLCVTCFVTGIANVSPVRASEADPVGDHQHPGTGHEEESTSVHDESRHWHLQLRLLLQNDWRHDEPIESSIGFGTALEAPLFRAGHFHIGLEGSVDGLFREGDIVLPVELGLKGAFDTGSMIEPYFGLAPVVLIDFGEHTEAHVGGSLTFGVTLHTGRVMGFFVQGNYRLLGGHGFMQQLAISLGPVFFF